MKNKSFLLLSLFLLGLINLEQSTQAHGGGWGWGVGGGLILGSAIASSRRPYYYDPYYDPYYRPYYRRHRNYAYENELNARERELQRKESKLAKKKAKLKQKSMQE